MNQSFLATFGRIWAWLFLLILVIIFSLTGQGFFSLFNFQSVGANMAILLIMAIGQTFVVISGGIDLSAGFVMGLSSVVGAMTITALQDVAPLPVVVLCGMLVGISAGLVAGFVNGSIIARLKVPPFIATLGMYGIARGAAFLFSGGMPVPARSEGLGKIGNGYLAYFHPEVGFSILRQPVVEATALRNTVGILPNVLVFMLVLVFIAHWVLINSNFGLHTYAIGGNAEAAIRAGIPVANRTVAIYMVSAFFAALAGFVYNVRFTNGAGNAGDALLLDSIAAVVIGGASLFGGAGTITGTLIGALIIAVIQNGLVILGIDPFWQFIAVGVIIILAVLVDQARASAVE